MYYKIVNHFDIECLEDFNQYQLLKTNVIDEKDKLRNFANVIENAKSTIETFDDNYGATRHPGADLGGYVLIFPTIEHTELFLEKIMGQYSLQPECVEFQDILEQDGKMEWVMQIYILSSDYCLVLIFPRKNH
ncbi:hypothetical protein [[Clostridium] fimetarium]|uniref:Uncharacterized protein n=1 Tax=[Clostridium] fimetarium TaxID=99656 RepID=A0A1I0MXW4_9FIRM|nr:hypothetical protein [[Clostridium] fimetarium]SEV93628.1 hypothetical protein SAMN05421659_102239 [[Clostridium] fimetarium]